MRPVTCRWEGARPGTILLSEVEIVCVCVGMYVYVPMRVLVSICVYMNRGQPNVTSQVTSSLFLSQSLSLTLNYLVGQAG